MGVNCLTMESSRPPSPSPPRAATADSSQEEPASLGPLVHVPLWSTPKGMTGLALIVLAGLGELLLVQSFGKRTGELGAPPWSIPHVAATTFLPALLAMLGDGLRRRWLYGLGLIWLVLSGALCVAGGLVWSLGDVFGLAVLSAGVLTLIGTKMLDASKKP